CCTRRKCSALYLENEIVTNAMTQHVYARLALNLIRLASPE
ncbi:MAG: hypothetical protein ACI9HK_002657, partial [Pirellulaceae bacterium]